MAERLIRAGSRWLAVFGLLLAAATATLADNEAAQARMKKDIFFLASEQCEGRGIETEGINKAADYIAGQFKQAGLRPGGVNGYFQPFTVNLGRGNVEQGKVELKGALGQTVELNSGKDFEVMELSANGKVTAPVVFVGYGVQLPDGSYDDYKNIDVAGKIVVILRRVPRWDNTKAPFAGNRETHAGFENKIGLAESLKAKAVLFVNDRSESAGGDKFANFPGIGAASIPVIQLKRAVLEMMLTASGRKLSDIEADIDRTLTPRSFPVADWTVTVQATVKRQTVACKNIIGIVDGAGPLKDEIVVVGSHYDHLGYGGFGSLAKDKSKKEIHPGADDNGSGTTSVMELARRFAAMKDRQGRTIVFMCFSAEERGLLGSKYYCNKEPLIPLDKTVAMVNLDMVGRLKDNTLRVEGVGTAKGFDELVEQINGGFDFKLSKAKGGQGPSDHDSFCRKKIPVLFFWTGLHNDYHRPTDTADRINVPAMEKIATMAEKVLTVLATQKQRPEYVQVASSAPATGGGPVPKMRVAFAYNDESNKGTLIEAVTEGGPGDKAGLKAGDRITAINGKATPNINAYMTVMYTQKGGVPIELTVDRSGKEMKLKVTPE